MPNIFVMRSTKKVLFLVYIFLFFSVFASAHPIYVSICQIDYNRENKSLEISVKIFADDLLLALENKGERIIFLGEERERADANEIISNYIHSKLKLVVNGKKVEYKFIGKELESDAVWSYLETVNVGELKEIEVTCDILTEMYETQNNAIQVNNGDVIKTMLLNNRKTKDSINF